ncbi:response regulator [Rhizobium sp. TH2]|uniref:MHYT domain-containing protein n=1 Tax=Rhizobium sp. TH2 TaxID=2775403 RepID=UPI002157BFCB|nr:MHYT domain-containing protein [Rhizobium sp. TH2]UVC10153.1 response regulator [Rhizobium sp. TH2]
MLSGTYDTTLVTLSILIAIAASYTALDLAGRIKAATGRVASANWLVTAALAMGGGIWAMHFVAMLAYSMPGMDVSYDVSLTVLSLVLAIVVTGIGFFVVSRSDGGLLALVSSGALMGVGIAGMHYTGMAAMRMRAMLTYDPLWVAISVFIAIAAAIAALWLAFERTGHSQKILAAVFMGFAVSGMHYTGMRAATYTTHHARDMTSGPTSFDQFSLALGVAVTTFFILGLALIASIFDRRFAVLAEGESEALRRSEERFRSLYRKTPMPLFSMTETGKMTEVSDDCLNLLGVERAAMIGQPLDRFMPDDAAAHWREGFRAMLIKDGFVEGEFQVLGANGRTIDVYASARLEVPDGGGVAVLGGLVDVTKRKNAEAALRQAQKMEAVGQLTGGIAHDFNNLLAVIMGNLELLKKRVGDDPKLQRLVETAFEAGRRGANLTQRMLSFARQQHLSPASVDVGELVTDMNDLLQRSLGPQFRIETSFPDQPVLAHADAHQLEMALLNLVVNARDALGESGTIEIDASLRTIANGDRRPLEPGDYAVLSVIDFGAGMDKVTLARAHEPFFTTKGVAKGTGLGLSMVHGFAQQSGGWLDIQSSPGSGTTVEIWLPAAQVSRPLSARIGSGEDRPNQKLRVLCVDDDALVLMSTVELLEELGHRPVSAHSGQAALSVLENEPEPFDLLLTDQSMPGMSGLQLAEIVRASHPTIPIVVATGYSELSEHSKLKLPILRKPFTQTDLEGAISQVTSARASQAG